MFTVVTVNTRCLRSSSVLIAIPLLSGPVRVRLLAGVSAIAAFGIFYFIVIAPPQALARITQFSTDQGSGRVDLWKVAGQMVRHDPIFGVGAGNFRIVEPLYTITDINLRGTFQVLTLHNVVHNTYLHVLAELGAVGLILFIAVIGAALMMATRAVRRFAQSDDFEMEILGRGVIVGTLGMLTAFFFLSAQHEKQLPLVLGVLMALLSLARASTSRANGRGFDPLQIRPVRPPPSGHTMTPLLPMSSTVPPAP